MFEADSQNFASASLAPGGLKLQNFRPAFGGDHRGTLKGGGSQPNPPPSPPFPSSNTSLDGSVAFPWLRSLLHHAWLMHVCQAAPNAKIISMDPRMDMSHWDKGTTYYTGSGTPKPGQCHHCPPPPPKATREFVFC